VEGGGVRSGIIEKNSIYQCIRIIKNEEGPLESRGGDKVEFL